MTKTEPRSAGSGGGRDKTTPTELLASLVTHWRNLAKESKHLPAQYNTLRYCANALECCATTLSAREDGWQPIETAPKDGTLILGWFENPRWPSAPGVLQWIDHNGGGWTHYPMGTPTHWMPLPKAPTAGEGK